MFQKFPILLGIVYYHRYYSDQEVYWNLPLKIINRHKQKQKCIGISKHVLFVSHVTSLLKLSSSVCCCMEYMWSLSSFLWNTIKYKISITGNLCLLRIIFWWKACLLREKINQQLAPNKCNKPFCRLYKEIKTFWSTMVFNYNGSTDTI